MNTYVVKLIHKKKIAQATFALTLERPAKFEFTAGQYVTIQLIGAPDSITQKNTRTFSIASPPYEDNVLIAFRMRDTNFKNLILGLEPGAELLLDGPHSDFVLPHRIDAPVVFLAGGVGITPIRSILLQELHEQLLTTFYLFYSNHTPEDAPFLEELLSIKKSNVHIIPTITQIGEFEKFWNWEMGHITLNMIHKYVPDPSIPYYYIAGPPSFVNAMNTMLKNSSVEISRIVSIEFLGY